MSFESLIALRHLKGRNRSKTVSLLTVISILGVVVGVWALIVVLSVLSGFGQDLRKKVIESTPNIVVDRHQGEFAHAKQACTKVLKVHNVKECSPFVLNEIMLASGSSTTSAGALLRGISKGSARIQSLTKQMRSGHFSHLFNPKLIPTPPSRYSSKKSGSDALPLLPPALPNTTAGKGSHAPDIKEFLPFKDIASPGPDARPSSRRSIQRRVPPHPKVKIPTPVTPRVVAPVARSKVPSTQDEFDLPFDKDIPKKKPKKKILPGILLGQELARNLGVSVGDRIRAVSPIGGTLTPMGPSPRIRSFRVAGIFYTGMYEYDTKFAFVALSSAQQLFKMDETVTGLELGVQRVFSTRPTKKDVRRALGGGPYRVRDWVEMNSQLFGALKMEKIVMFLILALIILVASFNIVSTLTMVVLEKAEEIAILKSMGATRGSIMRIFMIEGVSIGIVGTLVGLLLGWRTCLFLINHPIKMDQNVYYILHLPIQMNGSDFVAVALAAIAISFLATVYPALQAARLHPVEGLQHE